jgi:hypothetical protein
VSGKQLSLGVAQEGNNNSISESNKGKFKFEPKNVDTCILSYMAYLYRPTFESEPLWLEVFQIGSQLRHSPQVFRPAMKKYST